MIEIICFKWKKQSGGYLMPSQEKTVYGKDHIIKLHMMLKRFMSKPFRLTCITDDPDSISSFDALGIRVRPLWDKCRYLGGCFNRLYIFSQDMRLVLGVKKFTTIDIDCVITSDVTHIFEVKDDFKMNSYQPSPGGWSAENQEYNGSLIQMRVGSRAQVWNDFDFEKSPAEIFARKDIIGTDQAWIKHKLGSGEKRFTSEDDGIYEARLIKDELPKNASIIFFSGKRDPSSSFNRPWVKQFYPESVLS